MIDVKRTIYRVCQLILIELVDEKRESFQGWANGRMQEAHDTQIDVFFFCLPSMFHLWSQTELWFSLFCVESIVLWPEDGV